MTDLLDVPDAHGIPSSGPAFAASPHARQSIDNYLFLPIENPISHYEIIPIA
jgi:hypothetical protein